VARNQNTFAKRQREADRKRKAAEKIARRRQVAADAKAAVARQQQESQPVDGEPVAVEP
jgi:hypothetical protein